MYVYQWLRVYNYTHTLRFCCECGTYIFCRHLLGVVCLSFNFLNRFLLTFPLRLVLVARTYCKIKCSGAAVGWVCFLGLSFLFSLSLSFIIFFALFLVVFLFRVSFNSAQFLSTLKSPRKSTNRQLYSVFEVKRFDLNVIFFSILDRWS